MTGISINIESTTTHDLDAEVSNLVSTTDLMSLTIMVLVAVDQI
jgi:hypothetical protein